VETITNIEQCKNDQVNEVDVESIISKNNDDIENKIDNEQYVWRSVRSGEQVKRYKLTFEGKSHQYSGYKSRCQRCEDRN